MWDWGWWIAKGEMGLWSAGSWQNQCCQGAQCCDFLKVSLMFHNWSIGKCHPNTDNTYKGYFFSCCQAKMDSFEDSFLFAGNPYWPSRQIHTTSASFRCQRVPLWVLNLRVRNMLTFTNAWTPQIHSQVKKVFSFQLSSFWSICCHCHCQWWQDYSLQIRLFAQIHGWDL